MQLVVLRWSLALALGIGACVFVLSIARGAHVGVHAPVALGMGVAELLAAALLVVPRTRQLGGALLLATLVVAAVLHLLMGQAPPVAFLVYAAALWVVIREPVS